MGMSPLAGLVMGTRSGDLDPAVIFHLHRVGGLSLDEIDDLLNQRQRAARAVRRQRHAGRCMRRRAAGDPAATLAFDVYCRRITEYVGAYLAVLGRRRRDHVHRRGRARTPPASGRRRWPAWACSASPSTPARNERGGPVISPDGSAVAVCVVPTDEELEIATQTRTALD